MSNKGIFYGIGAYLMWGFFPLYFKALQAVPAFEIMFHRVVWCFLFLAVVILVKKEWSNLKVELRQAARPAYLCLGSSPAGSQLAGVYLRGQLRAGG